MPEPTGPPGVCWEGRAGCLSLKECQRPRPLWVRVGGGGAALSSAGLGARRWWREPIAPLVNDAIQPRSMVGRQVVTPSCLAKSPPTRS